MKLFRDLGPAEEQEFRQWARNNYEPHSRILGIWHPVVQDECVRINEENNEIKTPFDDSVGSDAWLEKADEEYERRRDES